MADPGELVWSPAPDQIVLPQRAVHLWRKSLEIDAESRHQLARTLSPDEHERAQRFVFDRDRQRYIVARGTLRGLLATYLHARPEELTFEYGAQGKPTLGGPWRRADLTFNLSHSQTMAVYAFTRQQPIGVDVEYVRPLPEVLELAIHTFSNQENAVLTALPAAHHQQAFFNCWTRKEAFIKAVGQGLSYPLGNFDVSLAPEAPAQLLRLGDDPAGHLNWAMVAFTPAPSYAAAVAVDGVIETVMGWDAPDRFNL